MIYYISRGLVLSGQGVHCTHLQDLHQAFTGERPDIIERLALISTLAILGWQESTPDLPVPFNPHDVFRVDWQMQKLLEEGTRLIVQMDAVDQPKWWTRSLWNSLRGTSYNQVTIIAPKSL